MVSQDELKAIAKTVLQHTHGFNALAWDLWGNEVHTNAQYLVWVSPSRRQARKCLYDLDTALVPEDIAKVMNPEGAEGGRMRPWNFWPLGPPRPDPRIPFTNLGK